MAGRLISRGRRFEVPHSCRRRHQSWLQGKETDPTRTCWDKIELITLKMLYISPRNTVEGDIAVIEAADCHLWLLPSSGSNIQRLFDRIKLDTFDLPDLSFFLDGPPVARYEYKKSWEQGRKDPCWVLHTSGSTGNPKPVIRYQDSVASIEANILLPPVDGRPLLLHEYFDSRVYLTFPFFHVRLMFTI